MPSSYSGSDQESVCGQGKAKWYFSYFDKQKQNFTYIIQWQKLRLYSTFKLQNII